MRKLSMAVMCLVVLAGAVLGAGQSPVRTLQITGTNVSNGAAATVSVQLFSLGDENAVAFSLSFDPARLRFGSVVLGGGTGGTTLLVSTNQAGSGRIGLSIAQGPGQSFSAGLLELARVTFIAGATAGDTTVVFGDAPLGREIVDVAVNELNATFVNGIITIGAAVNLVPTVSIASPGDGATLTAPATVLLSANAEEKGGNISKVAFYQGATLLATADHSPYSYSWNNVAAGRYSLTAVATDSGGVSVTSSVVSITVNSAVSARALQIGSTNATSGTEAAVPVQMLSLGDENAVSFSLSFDPARLRFGGVVLGAGTGGATLLASTNQAGNGRIGLSIAQGPGRTFSAGLLELARVTFIAGATVGDTTVVFGDAPLGREIIGVAANDLSASYGNGIITIGAGGSVVRVIMNGTNVSIAATPASAVSSYTVAEVLPPGLTPENVNPNGQWVAANRQVQWGPYYDTKTRTFSYTMAGNPGTYSVSGGGVFDGSSVSTTGDARITILPTVNVSAPLYSFSAVAPTNYTNGDGAEPRGPLVLLENTFYGTTYIGGRSGNGTVFAINSDGSGFRILHHFSAISNTTNDDGANPSGGLSGRGDSLYGTASRGGRAGWGTVFKLNIDGTGFSTLFCFNGGSDGAYPDAELVLSGNRLYGTALGGGSEGLGTVFAIDTDGTHFRNLHNFTGADGSQPDGGLVLSNNTLYGTTVEGGGAGLGTVFAVNTDGVDFRNLHSFSGASDGAHSQAGLMLLGDMLYGTASQGGSAGGGTVFAVHTDGAGFRVLHCFTGTEGSKPVAGLILSGRTLYGTASQGGSAGGGTVFAVNTDGGAFTIQHTFNGAEGGFPAASLILSGNTVYGTAEFGGCSGGGTVFGLRLMPVLTVTANNAVKHLEGPFPTLTTKSITGFVNGDSTNVINQWPQWATVADANSPIGSYDITNSVPALASNYVFRYEPGVLTITSNHPPVARNDSVTAVPDGITKIVVLKLLANDSDPDGDAVSLVRSDYPLYSTKGAKVDADKSGLWIHYNTESKLLDTNGFDTFGYRVQDGYGGTNQAIIFVKYVVRDSGAIPSNCISGVQSATDGSITFTFMGISGRLYLVQGTTNLKTGWSDLTLIDRNAFDISTNRFRCVNGVIVVTDTDASTHASMFYRAIYAP